MSTNTPTSKTNAVLTTVVAVVVVIFIAVLVGTIGHNTSSSDSNNNNMLGANGKGALGITDGYGGLAAGFGSYLYTGIHGSRGNADVANGAIGVNTVDYNTRITTFYISTLNAAGNATSLAIMSRSMLMGNKIRVQMVNDASTYRCYIITDVQEPVANVNPNTFTLLVRPCMTSEPVPRDGNVSTWILDDPVWFSITDQNSSVENIIAGTGIDVSGTTDKLISMDIMSLPVLGSGDDHTNDYVPIYSITEGEIVRTTRADFGGGGGGSVNSVTAGIGLSDSGTAADPIIDMDIDNLPSLTVAPNVADFTNSYIFCFRRCCEYHSC